MNLEGINENYTHLAEKVLQHLYACRRTMATEEEKQAAWEDLSYSTS